jgi:hypothetical protein
MVMKSTVFWNIMLCSLLKVNRCFRGIYHFHLQGRALLVSCFHTGFSLGLFFDHEDGGDIFLWNVGWSLAVYTALYPRINNSFAICLFQENVMNSLTGCNTDTNIFCRTCSLQLQCQRVSQAFTCRTRLHASPGVLLVKLFNPEDGGDVVLWNASFPLNYRTQKVYSL